MTDAKSNLGKRDRNNSPKAENKPGLKELSKDKLLPENIKKALAWTLTRSVFTEKAIEDYYHTLISVFNCTLCGVNGDYDD